MIGRNIIILMNIISQIIQMRNTFLNHKFPVTHTYCKLVCFMELPIKIIMLFWFSSSPNNVGAKEIPSKQSPSRFYLCIFRKLLISYKLTESRHNIIKSKLMIIHGTSFHFPWPTHDKRDSYATFITLALQATQFSVTTKNSGSAPPSS